MPQIIPRHNPERPKNIAPGGYIERGEPGYIAQQERMAAEWMEAYRETKKHVASQKEALNKFVAELQEDRQPDKAELRSKLLTYMELHRRTLDCGLYRRAQDILHKLEEIAAQAPKNDPHGTLQRRNMIMLLEAEWAEVDPSFDVESVEPFRVAEEKAWLEVVEAHRAWSSQQRDEIDQVFAKLANMMGMVRLSGGSVYDRAALNRTPKEIRKAGGRRVA